MITVILETQSGRELVRCSSLENERFLVRNESHFELLSLVDVCSYNCFAPGDMDKLIAELETIRDCVSADDADHLSDIIRLAKLCRDGSDVVLTFTPFEPR
jgi:hypothetical protein